MGDGGNEIGMGNLAEFIPRYEPLPKRPCVTTVTAPVIASVANWGCYGVVAALSRLLGRNLLIGVDEERRLVERCVEIGAVDGATGDRAATVDGHTLDVNEAVLADLHRLLGGGR